MVGESFVAIKGIEISELGIDVEVQQKRHLSVVGSFPDDDSLLVTLGAAVVRQRAVREYLLDLSPPVGYSTRHSLPAPRHLPLLALQLAGRQPTHPLPCPHQAVAANGRPVPAVSSAAPPSCEVVLEPRRSLL